MNNSTTRTTLTAIAAVLMIATLVVGGTLASTTAFAYKKNKGGGQENGKNGNTVTIQKCKQDGTVSGFDNTDEQECQNVICTHPGENATCTQEGVRSISTPTPTPEPTTTTLRIIKKVVCQSTDPNCSIPATCVISGAPSSNPQAIKCQAAIGNGVLVTLQPGDDFHIGVGQEPFFDATFEGDCEGTIAAGQHLTCTITNTQRPTTGTLLVRKLCVTSQGFGCDPNFHFPIEITGNNNPQPQPSTFVLTPDSSQLVRLGPGTYTITEGTPAGVPIIATFSGNCMQSGLLSATGTISAGEDQTCTINNLRLPPPSPPPPG
jgi:hypothetical protein